jgi:hypothetical protein
VLEFGRVAKWSAGGVAVFLVLLYLLGTDHQGSPARESHWCERLLALRHRAQQVAVVGPGARPDDVWLRRFDRYDYLDEPMDGTPVWPELRRTRRRYDLLAVLPGLDSPHGWAEQWSAELFAQASRHLGGHGMAALVVPLDRASAEQVRTLSATWSAVFGPTAQVVRAHESADGERPTHLLLLGVGDEWPTLDWSAVPTFELAGAVSEAIDLENAEAHSLARPRLAR